MCYLWWLCCWVTVFVPVIELNWIELNGIWVGALPGLLHLGLKTGSFCPLFCTKLEEPCSFSKYLSFLISSGSKKNEPRYVCLSEAKVSQLHKMWTEVSYSVPHFLQVGLLVSPISSKSKGDIAICFHSWSHDEHLHKVLLSRNRDFKCVGTCGLVACNKQ